MSLDKSLKLEIEQFVGKQKYIDLKLFDSYIIERSHLFIKDNTRGGHDNRVKIRNKMRNYCKKLVDKNNGRC